MNEKQSEGYVGRFSRKLSYVHAMFLIIQSNASRVLPLLKLIKLSTSIESN